MVSVIFDMDGTLLDTQRICIPAWEYAGRLQGIKGMGKCVPDVCGMNRNGSTYYLKTNFPALDIDLFRKNERKYIEDNLEVKFKAGAEKLIAYLKGNGIKFALASGTSRPSVEHHLNKLGILDIFDAIVCGGEVENGKPAPDIFLHTAGLMGAKPEECFVFEDSVNGIEAGYSAGMKCIGIPDIASFDSEIKKKLFAELSSLDEAIDILRRYI